MRECVLQGTADRTKTAEVRRNISRQTSYLFQIIVVSCSFIVVRVEEVSTKAMTILIKQLTKFVNVNTFSIRVMIHKGTRRLKTTDIIV